MTGFVCYVIWLLLAVLFAPSIVSRLQLPLSQTPDMGVSQILPKTDILD